MSATVYTPPHLPVTDQPAPRIPRPRGPVDVTRYRREVEVAIHAFGADVSYAVAMARAAVTITRKRAVWQARREEQAPAASPA